MPVPYNDGSRGSISPHSKIEQEMKRVYLFILSKASINLTGLCNFPFGGKTFVLGGNFQQTLPIVTRGHNFSVVNYCVKSSNL